MSALDTIIMLIPVITYVALLLAVRAGKLASIYLFATVTLATTILGIVSISIIPSIDFSAGGVRGLAVNALVATYIGAMIYGAFGAKKHNVERMTIGLIAVLLVSIVSGAI